MTFEEIILTSNHRYIVNGTEVPGVTAVLQSAGLTPDWTWVAPEVLNRKAELGSSVHRITEYLDTGLKEEPNTELKPYVEGWNRFLDTIDVGDMEMPEFKVYSSKYRYAGTIDRVCLMNGKPTILDIKTTVGIYPVVGIQLAAYEQAYREYVAIGSKTVFKRVAVQLKKDGTYRIHEFDDPNDFNVFFYALQLQNWKHIHKT